MNTDPTPGVTTSEFKILIGLVLAHIAVVVYGFINPSGNLTGAQQATIAQDAGVAATALVALYGTWRTWLKAQATKAQATVAAATAVPAEALTLPSVVPADVAPFNPADHLPPPPTVTNAGSGGGGGGGGGGAASATPAAA